MLTNQRIEELINGIEHYLGKLDNFSNELREIKAALNESRNSQEKSYMWELKNSDLKWRFLNQNSRNVAYLRQLNMNLITDNLKA